MMQNTGRHDGSQGREAAIHQRHLLSISGGEAMHLGQWGVFCFTDALTPAQLIALAQRTEQLGYAAL
jgi:hypothetical protein